MNKIKLGVYVTDKITGFKGVVTATCQYITGCNQVFVQPKTDEKGGFIEGRWIDDDRLQVDTTVPVMSLEVKNAGFGPPAPIK